MDSAKPPKTLTESIQQQKDILERVIVEEERTTSEDKTGVNQGGTITRKYIDKGESKSPEQIRKEELIPSSKNQMTPDEFLEGLQGDQPVGDKPNKSASDAPRTVQEAVLKWTGAVFFGFKGKLNIAFRDSPKRVELANKLGDAVRKLVRGAEKYKLDQTNKLFGHLEEKTGKTKDQVLELIRKGKKKNEIVLTYYDKDGALQTTGLSLMGGVKLLMQLDNPNLHEGLSDGNGFSEYTREDLVNKLNEADPAYVKIAEAYSQQYKDMYGDVSIVFKENEGTDLPRQPKYSGYTQRERHDTTADLDAFDVHMKDVTGSNFKPPSTKPKFTKKVTNPDMAVKLDVDAHTDMMQYIGQASRYVKMSGFSKNVMKPIFASARVRRASERKSGGILMQALEAHWQDILYGQAKREHIWFNFVDKLFAGARFSKLATKPISFIKNYLSLAAGSQFVPVVPFIDGIRDYYTNPFEKNKILSQSEQYQVRYADVATTMSGVPSNAGVPLFLPQKVVSAGKAVSNVLMSPVTLGAKAAALPTMWSAYKWKLSQGVNHEDAMLFAEEVVERTANSGAIDITSNLSRLPGGRWVTVFQQQQITFAETTILAWDHFAKFPSGNNFKNAIRTSVVTGIGMGIFPAVDAAYKAFISKDEDKKKEAWFKAQYQTINSFVPGATLPIVSDALITAETLYHNNTSEDHYHFFDPSDIPASTGKYTYRFLNDVLKHTTEDDWDGDVLLQTASDFNKGPGTVLGLPFDPPLQLYKDLKERNEE